jgi:D-alanyl-D-alanine carboxypeptidase
MNVMAVRLRLNDTKFASVHGLSNKNNKSTASDIAKLTTIALKNKIFREIIGTKKHSCQSKLNRVKNQKGQKRYRSSDAIRNEMNSDSSKHEYVWENTNKILGYSGCYGVKTGVTPAAGPCLASAFKIDEFSLVVILINSRSMEHRWGEVLKLANWTISRLRRLRKFSKGDLACEKRILAKIRHL